LLIAGLQIVGEYLALAGIITAGIVTFVEGLAWLIKEEPVLEPKRFVLKVVLVDEQGREYDAMVSSKRLMYAVDYSELVMRFETLQRTLNDVREELRCERLLPPVR
jgi:hypothetical protein